MSIIMDLVGPKNLESVALRPLLQWFYTKPRKNCKLTMEKSRVFDIESESRSQAELTEKLNMARNFTFVVGCVLKFV
jgi:hypothetical protein